MRTQAWFATDVGKIRQNNEDSYLVDNDHSLFVVADGVGGKDGGEVASQAVVERLGQWASRLKALADDGNANAELTHRDRVFEQVTDYLQDINQYIYDVGHQPPYNGGMATTADLLLVSNGSAFIAHVGDSRIYLLRDDDIFRLTRDHTLAEQIREEGGPLDPEMAKKLQRYTHVLTRSMGSKPQVEIDTLLVDVRPGDRFLMCTDGITDYLSGTEIQRMGRHFAGQGFVDGLVKEALARGGKDNITVVVAEVVGDQSAAQPWSDVRLDARGKIGFLEDIELFKGLESQELLKLLRIVVEKHYTDGEEIIRRGGAADGMFVVVEGEVALSVEGRLLATLPAGKHFGELALFSDEKRTADAHSVGNAYLLLLPSEALRQLVSEDPRLGNRLLWKMLAYAARYIRNMTDEIARTKAGGQS